MHVQDVIYYEDIADLIDEVHGQVSAADLHGMMCGELSAGMAPPDEAWLKACMRYLNSDEVLGAASRRELLMLRAQTRSLLEDEGLAFMMLLPDDDTLPTLRAEALGQWCQGFLHGFAVAEKISGHSLSQLEEVQEILADFAAVAEIDAEADEMEEEQAEADLMQLTEYVRMAVLTVFALCSIEVSSDNPPPATVH